MKLGTYYSEVATLLDKSGSAIGTCLDTPNAIAYCMAKDPQIASAKTILGNVSRNDLKDRFWFVVKDFSPEKAYWAKF